MLGAGAAVGAEAGADAAVAESGAALQSTSDCHPAYETVRTLKEWGTRSCCKNAWFEMSAGAYDVAAGWLLVVADA